MGEWPPSGAGLVAVGERSAAPEAELIAVAVTFHYLNRMVAVFLGDSPLPPEVPARARGPALRAFGRLMRPAARRTPPAGASLPLLPAAPCRRTWRGRAAARKPRRSPGRRPPSRQAAGARSPARYATC
ncbi:hypothetical protein ACFQQB_66485 [Nonomuraea rubra]|uniref:hypothetical protein n=1 Tax=Nonomuraea rubra TaxID=46180 RepID=UPI003608402B